MYLIEQYFGYWPVFTAGAVFLLMGLGLLLMVERAVERSRKPADWVRQYRKPGFPLRGEVLACRRLSFWAVLPGIVCALAVTLGLRGLAGLRASGSFFLLLRSRQQLLHAGLGVLGAAAAAAVLHLLFDSAFVTVLGSLLFATASAHGHSTASLLMLSLLCLLLYLRCRRCDLLPELWYLLSALVMAAAIGLQPRAVLFAPFMVLAHIWRIGYLRRADEMRFGTALGALVLALVCWCLFAVLAALIRTFAICSFGIRTMLIFLRKVGFKVVCAELYYFVLRNLFVLPTRGQLLYPMVEAGLFGLGIFGAVSGLRAAVLRRNPRGWLCVVLLLLTAAVWAATGLYTLPVGLTLCLGCLLKNAVVGRKTGWAAAACVLGIAYQAFIAASVWLMPLVAGVADHVGA